MIQSLRKFGLGIIIGGMVVYFPAAQALSVSDISLNSSLNQRLDASIDLVSVSPEEFNSMVVAVHPADKNGALAMFWPRIGHEIVSCESGRYQIRLSSDQPIKEPVVSFVIELNWSGGRFEREYVLLIDPDMG